jgi:hypothetical protein
MQNNQLIASQTQNNQLIASQTQNNQIPSRELATQTHSFFLQISSLIIPQIFIRKTIQKKLSKKLLQAN